MLLETSATVRSEAIRLAVATPFTDDRIFLELQKLTVVRYMTFHGICRYCLAGPGWQCSGTAGRIRYSGAEANEDRPHQQCNGHVSIVRLRCLCLLCCLVNNKTTLLDKVIAAGTRRR